MNNIEKQIAEYLYDFYSGKNKNACTLYSVLENIAKKNNLKLCISYADNNCYDVQGNDGYKIIVFTLNLMKKLEERGIISFHKQGEPSVQFTEIDYSARGSDVAKISGDLAKYITDFHYYVISIDKTITNFKDNRFVDLQLKEAKKQTKLSIYSLIIAIASILLPIIIGFLCN